VIPTEAASACAGRMPPQTGSRFLNGLTPFRNDNQASGSGFADAPASH
jgi:hypothetical protein